MYGRYVTGAFVVVSCPISLVWVSRLTHRDVRCKITHVRADDDWTFSTLRVIVWVWKTSPAALADEQKQTGSKKRVNTRNSSDNPHSVEPFLSCSLPQVSKVSLGKLFSFADGKDKLYMAIGTIAACLDAL